MNIFDIPCWTTNITKQQFTNIIKRSHIIVTQPISDNYRNKHYLSTSYIIKKAHPYCKIIIVDSCYFNFYYFDLSYKEFNNNRLSKPVDYHYNSLIECYKNKNTIQYYLDNYVNNIDLKSSEELEDIANNSLQILNERFNKNKNKYKGRNIYHISTSKFIKNNYKHKLLFYSMNHPTKHLIQFICKQIIKICKIPNTINYNVDKLNFTKCIIYKCISKNIHFNINQHTPLTKNCKNNEKIVKLYYDTYKSIKF
jgi:hypothetical protein